MDTMEEVPCPTCIPDTSQVQSLTEYDLRFTRCAFIAKEIKTRQGAEARRVGFDLIRTDQKW